MTMPLLTKKHRVREVRGSGVVLVARQKLRQRVTCSKHVPYVIVRVTLLPQ